VSDLEIIRIDGIKWWMTTLGSGTRYPVALCPDHDLRMEAVPPRLRSRSGGYYNGNADDGMNLSCAEGPHTFPLPRKFSAERQYVINRIDAKVFKNAKVLNLDDEAIPIAKAKKASKDDKYFITAQLMESKRGLQAVIYAGEKGNPKKTQIFINPASKSMSFDHKDLHPSDIFLKIESTFDDGSKSSIEKTKDPS